MNRSTTDPNAEATVQLHLVLPYKQEARTHPRVARLLEQGYRIVQLQRVTDREALLTLTRTGA